MPTPRAYADCESSYERSGKCSFCGMGPVTETPDPLAAGGWIHPACLQMRDETDKKYPGISGLTDEPEPYVKTLSEFAQLLVSDFLRGDKAAEAFIFGPQEGWIISFRDCCLNLGIDIERARKKLRVRFRELNAKA